LVAATAVLAAVPIATAAVAHHLTRREAVEARLSRALLAATDSVYRVAIGTAELHVLDRSYRVTDVRLIADSSRIEALRLANRRPRTRGSYRIGAVQLDRIDLSGLLRGDIGIGAVRFIQPKLEIYLDRTVPIGEYHALPLPHEWVQRLDRRLRIDTVLIEGGEVVYWERAVDGARPGRLRFADIRTTVSGVTNDRSPAVPERAVIDLEARLGGGRLEAHLAYDLLAPRLRIKYRGKLAAMDARAFNPMLVDLEGIRIDDGDINSVRFEIEVEEDLATGTVAARYQDLSIAVVDKVTRDRSLGDLIKSVVANKFKVREDNPDGDDPPMVASVRLRRPADTPLIKFIWHTLRAGISTTIGL
jgi:hypothetical protein